MKLLQSFKILQNLAADLGPVLALFGFGQFHIKYQSWILWGGLNVFMNGGALASFWGWALY